MDQDGMVEGVTRYLHCSRQVAVEPAPETEMGLADLHANDIRGQMGAAGPAASDRRVSTRTGRWSTRHDF